MARHSSTESEAFPQTAMVSSASSDGGAIEAASTTADADALSLATRASTTSRTVEGICAPPDASTSVT